MTSRERELIWAAGIIQGEGCIGVYPYKLHGTVSKLHITIQVPQSEPDWEMLDRLQQLWGGSIYLAKKQRPHHLRQKRWQIHYRMAWRACKELCACPEFRGPKRAKAEEIITYYRNFDQKKEERRAARPLRRLAYQRKYVAKNRDRINAQRRQKYREANVHVSAN